MEPSQGVLFGFVFIVALMAAVLVLGVSAAWERTGAGDTRSRAMLLACFLSGGWLVVSGYVAREGLLLNFTALPPRIAFVVVPALVSMLVVALGPVGARLARGLPLAALVGYQAFRVGVELVLWQLHREGFIPVQMTFEGRNFDIVTGILAIPLAILAARGRLARSLLLTWNWLGLALLLHVVVIAVLSMPYPCRVFKEGPANEIVLHAPWIWLPAWLVPLALLGHLLVFRAPRPDAASDATAAAA